MDEVRNVLDRAGRRLLIVDFLKRAVVLASVMLGLLVAARLGQKLVPLDLPWAIVFAASGGVVLVGAGVWAVATRKRELEVAREVDERAGLRESLSTAVYVGTGKDAWGRNVIETARERAGRVVLRDAVPVRAPARWPVPAALCLALVAVWWLPRYDVTGMFEEKAEQQAEVERVQEVAAEVKETEERIEAIAEKAGLRMEEGEGEVEADDPLEALQPQSAEDVQRAAIKKLTKLEDELKEITEGEKGAELAAMEDAMRRLQDPGPGPASEMAKQMAQGNFEKAQEALEKLMDEVQSGEMNEEQKQEAAAQLDQLKQQMEQMAEQQNEVSEQLQAAGFSKEQAERMAASADEMERQLSENQSMSEQQKESMQQAAQAQRSASDAMSSLAQSMGQMSQGMQQGSQSSQMQQGAESMNGQLGQMGQLQSEVSAAQQAMGEAQSAMQSLGESLCEGGGDGKAFGNGQQPGSSGQFSQGQTAMSGNGSGGPGKGNGAGPDQQRAEFTLQREKSNVNTQDGPLIWQSLVFGQQIRGESKAAFGGAVSAARAEAAEAIETRTVPREYENAVQGYFGRLESKVEQESSGGGE